MVVLISDLYDEPEAIFDALAPIRFRGSDVVVFHVLDPAELEFPFTDPSAFEDLETGEQMPVVPESFRDKYQALVRGHIEALTAKAAERGVDYRMLDTVQAARLRALRLPVVPRAHDPGALDGVPAALLPRGPGGAGRAGGDPPDPAREEQIIAFPSLMFVRRVPYESVRRRKIRHWALLAMRLAALALIVAAFARPFFRGGGVAAMAGGAREVVVLLDRSYSMGYGDRWTRAQAAARKVLDALGPADRASLVFFGTGAEVALQSIDDRARLAAAAGGGHAGRRGHAPRRPR